MKKILLLLVSAFIMPLSLTGCDKGKQVSEKLCRIEIAKADGQQNTTVLEQLKQSEVSEFFDENNWTETPETNSKLVPQYTISLYQEKTPTVIKSEDNEPYEKIMEYVTFENSEIVRVSISGDLANSSISEKYLSAYYVGSEKFFSALEKASEG